MSKNERTTASNRCTMVMTLEMPLGKVLAHGLVNSPGVGIEESPKRGRRLSLVAASLDMTERRNSSDARLLDWRGESSSRSGLAWHARYRSDLIRENRTHHIPL